MWGSSGRAPGVVAIVADNTRGLAWAHFVGLRADGTFLPPEPLATAADLGDRPRGCTPAERGSRPRLAMPLRVNGNAPFPGTRHPVIVREPAPKGSLAGAAPDPIILLTSGAVIHGPPSAPCVAAFQAVSAQRSATGAVIPGDMAHAWLFRVKVEPPPANARQQDDPVRVLEYAPMSCRYDPSAPVPDVVWTQEGTSAPAAP
jgi:hypothetical protein